MHSVRRCYRFLLLAWLLSAVNSWAGEPPAQATLTAQDIGPSWKISYGVYGPDGSKMGSAYGSFSGTQEKGFKLELAASIKAIGMERSQELEFEGQAPFALRKGRGKFAQAAISKSVEVSKAGDGLEAGIDESGKKRTKRLDEEYSLNDVFALGAWLAKQERKAGEKFIARELDLIELKVHDITYTVKEFKHTQVHGVKLDYYELQYDSSLHGEMGAVNVGRDGLPLSTKLAGQFDLRSEPEALAKQTEYKAGFSVEPVVKLEKPLGDPKKIAGMVLEAGGEAAAKIASGPRQTVAEQVLKLGAEHGAPAKATPEEIQENLKESAEYPKSNAEVVALAKKVADAKSEKEKVERLCGVVADLIEDRYSPSPLSVAEILAKKKGDCRQHALLFTTLARAAGLAAREVRGLAYKGDVQPAFGAYAWNEVVVEGVWIPVNPMQKELEPGAAYIRLNPEEKGLEAVAALAGKLELKVREVIRSK